jgi:hypothetical protein
MCLNDTRVTQVVVFWDGTSRSHSGANVSVANSAFIFRLPWLWGKQVPLICWYACTWLHGVTSQKTVFRMLVNSGNLKCHTFYSFTQNHSTTLRWYKAVPLQTWTGPWLSRRLRFPEFLDTRHMKVVRVSALRTSRRYPSGDIPGTHFS